MSCVNVFLLLPESHPSNRWMQSNEPFQKEDGLNRFVKELDEKMNTINIENYTGYYDRTNIINFLEDYEILKDYYPQPAKTLLYEVFKNNSLGNWNDEKVQSTAISYTLFGQQIKNHTFCEIAQRNYNSQEDKSLLLNHAAHVLGNTFDVCINNNTVSVDSCNKVSEIRNWFTINRQPVRNFHAIEKHGENRKDIKNINDETISPLRCLEHEASALLQTAIGDTVDELFNDDTERGHYIIFKYEGNNPQNMYHAYHVDYSSSEVPYHIKKRLQQ